MAKELPMSVELRSILDSELLGLVNRAHARGELMAAKRHWKRHELESVSEHMTALEDLVRVHTGDHGAAFLTRRLCYEWLVRAAKREINLGMGEEVEHGGA